jgi:hypothetical protein
MRPDDIIRREVGWYGTNLHVLVQESSLTLKIGYKRQAVIISEIDHAKKTVARGPHTHRLNSI